jgi:transposase
METLVMSVRERRRLTEFSRVKDGLISVAAAARSLGLSERQGRRLWRRYRRKGDAGLIHGLRGKKSNAGKEALRVEALALYRRKYGACNASHAADLLAREKLAVPRQTLWRWLKREGLIAQPRKSKKHRRRRERRSCVGELVQMDGSTHRWLGADLPEYVLFVMIDDATSQVYARFYATEDTASAFDLFGRYVKRNGLPGGLYVDHDSIYVVNESEVQAERRQAAHQPSLTQFGRAMAELGVEIIAAHSPQAKGRVERANRTLQDRLVKELALAMGEAGAEGEAGGGIKDLASANAFLEKKFLKAYNQRFGQTPARGMNAHRRVPENVRLAEVLCHKESRSVGQDWCVQYAGRILQIAKRHEALALAGRRIEVIERADGTLKLTHRGQALVHKELAERPVKKPSRKLPMSSRASWRPGPNHLWRRSSLKGSRAQAAAA